MTCKEKTDTTLYCVSPHTAQQMRRCHWPSPFTIFQRLLFHCLLQLLIDAMISVHSAMHALSFLEQLLSSVYNCVEMVSSNAVGLLREWCAHIEHKCSWVTELLACVHHEGMAVSTVSTIEADYLYVIRNGLLCFPMIGNARVAMATLALTLIKRELWIVASPRDLLYKVIKWGDFGKMITLILSRCGLSRFKGDAFLWHFKSDVIDIN